MKGANMNSGKKVKLTIEVTTSCPKRLKSKIEEIVEQYSIDIKAWKVDGGVVEEQ
jgi:hypothetical protein